MCPAAFIGETGENMHTRAKSHLTKFYSKVQKTRESSAFLKHIENTHGGLKDGDKFEDYFEISIMKAYKKPLTRNIEEGTFIVNYNGEILNSKNEWHQPKIIRTTIVQGGAEVIGGDIRHYQRDGGSQNAQSGVADDGVTVTSVDRPEGVHRNTRSRTIARNQGQ